MRNFLIGAAFLVVMVTIYAFIGLSLLASFFVAIAIFVAPTLISGFREGYSEKSSVSDDTEEL